MQAVRLAAFISGTDLQLIFPSNSHPRSGTPLHPQGSLATRLARRPRDQPMAGTFTSIHRREGSLHIRRIHTTYRACFERTRWGKSIGSVTCPTDSFFTGDTLGTCPGSYWAVHCGATDCRSTHHYFPLGWKVVLTLTSAICFYPIYIWVSFNIDLPAIAESFLILIIRSETSVTVFSSHHDNQTLVHDVVLQSRNYRQ